MSSRLKLRRVLRDLYRSSALKIALAFAFAVTATTYAVFAYVSWNVVSADTAQVRAVLQDEAAKAVTFSATAVKDRLTLRLTHDLRRLDYVGLFDARGILLFGNVGPRVLVPVDGMAHQTDAPLEGSDTSGPAIFVACRRADGGVLLLGRSLREVHHLQQAMRWAFVSSILPTILIALVAGIIVSRRASQRLSTIKQAIRRVMQGEISVRLPARRAADDINELVTSVNLMLDEIVRLLNQIKSVGDNIAHDLKSPLAVVRVRLERAFKAESPDLLRKATKDAMVDLDKALTTVTALLRISELESSLRRSGFCDIDLVTVCEDIFDLFEPLASSKNISMTLDAPPTRRVQGDRDLLCEAVANLIENAIKFTPAGGTVVLECDRRGALIRVRDSGPGIRPEERDRIFKRFYRSKDAESVPGAGLGLSMASTIVELHGYILRVGDEAPGATLEVVQA